MYYIHSDIIFHNLIIFGTELGWAMLICEIFLLIKHAQIYYTITLVRRYTIVSRHNILYHSIGVHVHPDAALSIYFHSSRRSCIVFSKRKNGGKINLPSIYLNYLPAISITFAIDWKISLKNHSLLSFWLKADKILKIQCSQKLSMSYCWYTSGHLKTCLGIFITLAFVDL